MRLHDLRPRSGARQRIKRIGRGESSGVGKTSGRGHKGQHARAGRAKRPGFEGGQMPLIRRLPKRGFNNARHKTRYEWVNLKDLDRFDEGSHIDEAALRQAGLVKGRWDGVKLLGEGEVRKKFTVRVQAISASARQKIEAQGGTCEIGAGVSAGQKE